MLLKIYSSLLTSQEEHVFRKVPPGVILTKCGVVASYCVENPFHHTTKSDHVEEDFAIWLLLMLIERKSVFVSNSWVISHGHHWMMKILQMMGFSKKFYYCQIWIFGQNSFSYLYKLYNYVRFLFTFWVYYADDPLNCVPILEFESPALGLFWIPVQDLELFSNWRPKVLWWFEVRARDFVCKKSEIHVMIQLHFLTNFWEDSTQKKSPRQDF